MRVDLRRELRGLYVAGRQPSLVAVPILSFLMVDGVGDPNTSVDYQHALAALFSVSYTIKFALKLAADAIDYAVMPLEGLRCPDFSGWTAMIAQPDVVDAEIVDHAIKAATRRRSLPAAGKLRLEPLDEGHAAQMMHVGPYAIEGPTIAALYAFIAEQGYVRSGKHHEIYLSDPRRAKSERLRTILRQPIAEA